MSNPEAAEKANAAVTENKHMKEAGGFLSPGFNTSLFGCFGNIVGCLLACCLPCFPMASSRTLVDERDIHFMDIICCPNPYVTRQGIRKKYGIEPAPLNDCLALICCQCCVIYQNAAEIGNRTGNDPVFLKL